MSTVRSLTTPTPFGRRIDAAVCSDGSYGVPRGLVFGFPLRTEDWAHLVDRSDLYLDEFAQTKLDRNVTELEYEAVLAQEWFGWRQPVTLLVQPREG